MYFLSELMVLMYIIFSYLQLKFIELSNEMKYELWWGVLVNIADIPTGSSGPGRDIFSTQKRGLKIYISWIAMRVRTTDEELAFSSPLYSIVYQFYSYIYISLRPSITFMRSTSIWGHFRRQGTPSVTANRV